MDTHELDTILRRNTATQETFLGVFALDHLPTMAELDRLETQQEERGCVDRWFLVCNCCPSTQSGRHWIAVFYDRGSVEFFDSFALPPDAYDTRLATFVHRTTRACEVAYNNTPLQALYSDACGHYCILFGVARSRGDTFRSIVGEMTALTRDNLIKFIVNTLL